MPTVILTNNPLPPGNEGLIGSLFDASLSLLFSHTPNHPFRNCHIRVTYGAGGPHIRAGGSLAAGFDVHLLAAGGDLINQVYQFAHESCHVLARCQPRIHPNLWLEESLCEAASLFVMHELARLGENNQWPCVPIATTGTPPVQFYSILRQHVDILRNDPSRQFAGADMQAWLRANEAELRNNCYARHLTFVLANRIFELVANCSAKWAAVEFLNQTPCPNGVDSLTDYFANWEAATPLAHRGLINDLQRLLLK